MFVARGEREAEKFLFEKCEPIERCVIALEGCRSSKSALEGFERLGEALKEGAGLPALAKGRAKFIQQKFQVAIDESSGKSPLASIVSLFVESSNLKNALQVETFIFGWLYPRIALYHAVYSDPRLSELMTVIPNIFQLIRTDTLTKGYFLIKLEPLMACFDSFEAQPSEELFDVCMFSYMASSGLTQNQGSIKISLDTLPPILLIENCMRSEDPRIRLLAQILFILKVEDTLALEYYSFLEIDKTLLENHINGLLYEAYFEKKELIPHLAALMQLNRDLKVTYKNPINRLISRELTEGICAMTTPHWLEEASSAFNLIRRIELAVQTIIPRDDVKKIKAYIDRNGSDRWLLSFATAITKSTPADVKWSHPPINYSHPFCQTQEEFRNLALFYRSKKTGEGAMEPSSAGIEPKRSRHKEKKATIATEHTSEVTAEYLAGLGEDSVDDVDLTRLLAPSARTPGSKSAAGGAASSAPLTTKKGSVSSSEGAPPLSIEESIHNTRLFLTSLRGFEERVESFFRSSEEGVAYRQSKGEIDPKQPDYAVRVAQLVITHDFPEELLLFACNPLYSTPGIWGDRGELPHNHFSSCIYIDGKKHKLTVAFNRVKRCYHFSAKSIESWKGYFEHGVTEEVSAEVKVSTGGMVKRPAVAYNLDHSNNAIFNYRGRTIRIIKLK